MSTSTMSTIGERLKKTRESRSLTIDQVQKQTRIHSSVLIALEEGRCDKMLTPTYVKSFLKKYSVHLGLDPKELLDEYLSAHPELRMQESTSAEQIKKASTDRKGFDVIALLNKARPFLMVAAAICIIVLIAGGTAKFFKDRNRVRVVLAAKPKAKATTAARQKAAEKKPVAVPKEASKTASPAPKAASPASVVPKNEPIKVFIKAKQGVFVSAVADGEQVFKKHLPKGRDETIIADNSINLYIAKGESVVLSLNGKPVNLKKGLIKDLLITRKGVQAK